MQPKNNLELYTLLTEKERIIVDVLRQIILEVLPPHCYEKLTNNVPYFFGNRRICLVWPASIKGGGIKKGVLLGFSYGNRLNDKDNYLNHGTNKRIFYKIFTSVNEIKIRPIKKILKEAFALDATFSKTKKNILLSIKIIKTL